MNAQRWMFAAALLAVPGILFFNEWRLQRVLRHLAIPRPPAHTGPDAEWLDRLRQADTRYEEAMTQLRLAEQKLAAARALASAAPQTAILGPGNRPLHWVGDMPPEGLVFTPGEPLSAPGAKRSWGPEQVVGEPDTHTAGDIPTAWAPREQDGGEEWLKLDYETPVDITEVRVRETYNPGAVARITALRPDGSEVTLWEGVEPRHEAPVEMGFTVAAPVHAGTIKVYLDTRRVPGWNEIDAVQVLGRDGSKQWARAASASSTYADRVFTGRRLGLGGE